MWEHRGDAMGYEIHIERRDGDEQRLPIALKEWQNAVGATDGVRMAQGDSHVVNPRTGEIVTSPNSGGDAEMLFAANGEWVRVFHWHPPGRASFRATAAFDDENSDISRIARELAARLSAVLIGDDGEIYR